MASFDWKIILRLIPAVIKMVSPEVKEYLEKSITNLDEKAKTTKNPFDDLLVELLKAVLL